jgi:hypothetical protein
MANTYAWTGDPLPDPISTWTGNTTGPLLWTGTRDHSIGTLSMAPPSVVFTGDNGKPIVTFKPDGTIEVGEGYTPTAAADAMIAQLRRMHMLPPAPTAADIGPGELDLPAEMPEVLAQSVQFAAGEFSRRNYESMVEAAKGKTPYQP